MLRQHERIDGAEMTVQSLIVQSQYLANKIPVPVDIVGKKKPPSVVLFTFSIEGFDFISRRGIIFFKSRVELRAHTF